MDQLEMKCSVTFKTSAYSTLRVDESNEISVSKNVNFIPKFWNEVEFVYKTVFAGIVKLTARDSLSVFVTIQRKLC